MAELTLTITAIDAIKGNAIIFWKFRDAPPELQELSQHGGDEDWVCLCPKHMEQESIIERMCGRMEDAYGDGVLRFEYNPEAIWCFSTDRYEYGDCVVFIGAHS